MPAVMHNARMHVCIHVHAHMHKGKHACMTVDACIAYVCMDVHACMYAGRQACKYVGKKANRHADIMTSRHDSMRNNHF